MKVIQKLHSWTVLLFCFVVFATLFPSFYLLGTSYGKIHSQIVLIILNVVVFTIFTFENIFYNKISPKSKILIPVLIFLTTQTLSVISTINFPEFFREYKNLFNAILIFINILYLSKNKYFKNIFPNLLKTTLFLWGILNIYLFFASNSDLDMITNLIHVNYINLIKAHKENGKFFFESYFVSLVPLIMYLIHKAQKFKNKLIFITIGFVIFFLSLASNFRAIVVLLGLSILMAIYNYKKWAIKILFFYLFTTLSIFVLYASVLKLNIHRTVINRFLIESKEDYDSLNLRLAFYLKGLKIGFSSSLLGVGLGNFRDSISLNQSVDQIFKNKQKVANFQQATYTDPHNIFIKTFAETGLVGLLSFVYLVGFFILSDFHRIKKGNILLYSLIFAFWSNFLYGMVNPTYALAYLGFFWLMRGLIEVYGG